MRLSGGARCQGIASGTALPRGRGDQHHQQGAWPVRYGCPITIGSDLGVGQAKTGPASSAPVLDGCAQRASNKASGYVCTTVCSSRHGHGAIVPRAIRGWRGGRRPGPLGCCKKTVNAHGRGPTTAGDSSGYRRGTQQTALEALCVYRAAPAMWCGGSAP